MKKIFKKFLVILLVLFAYYLFLWYGKLTAQIPEPAVVPLKKSDVKYILYWNPFWKRRDYGIGFGSYPFRYCKYKKCFATDNRSFVPLEQYDAILFHPLSDKQRLYGVPSVRYPHQRYVFVNHEAPTHLCADLTPYRSFFNWTLTYRFDSDLIKRYGQVRKLKTEYRMPTVKDLRRKKKFAAWFFSHCNSSSKREVMRALQKYIPVDIYGQCGDGNNKCKRRGMTSTDACYDMLQRDYKFYFSFENALCKDYLTEKVYSILRRNVVPVVYGYDYKTMPPHSVIDVANFNNVSELAAYLKHLDANPKEYLKYFEWKSSYVIHGLQYTCDLCRKLHEPLKKSVYDDLSEWWWGKNKSVCKTSEQFPKIVKDFL